MNLEIVLFVYSMRFVFSLSPSLFLCIRVPSEEYTWIAKGHLSSTPGAIKNEKFFTFHFHGIYIMYFYGFVFFLIYFHFVSFRFVSLSTRYFGSM